MGQAYTPGLKVSPRMHLRLQRLLPLKGDVLVKPGDHVTATDVVARTLMPGDVVPVNLANALSIPPSEVPECVKVKVGDTVEVGQPLARSKGIFGLFQSEYRSKSAGTVESVSEVTGQMILRGAPLTVEVRAFITGEVVHVIAEEGVAIEAEVTLIQGIFGVGGEAYGNVVCACDAPEQELTPERITEEMKGCVIVGGGRMTGAAVDRALEVGAAAVVSGGMDDADLKEILGYDLGVAVTGSEKLGLTLIITEGFGEIAMAERSFGLFRDSEGRPAAVDGTTQIRAGVMRPQVVIPVGEANPAEPVKPLIAAGGLEVGTPVRIIRDPDFGKLGKVADLPTEPTVLDSGSKARVLIVELDSGEQRTVPRANVELIEQ
ncbi:hypothetical protein [Calycomorphotria hydatis]|uniref:RnfC Barrel sandwich hybrid domain-containing protein n=1 Tax=Calycomorphotria hydatis TaxID=2528027 RepID=A0A517T6P2_9PLAN|nr:hypothetical protein [Calycomorphotria hydatis]QDT64039.1 hypothetical protein V22_12690 [Calycomorphotria hydatis]